MNISPAGRAFIEEFEGLFLSAYDDATDHIVKPGDKVHGTLTIGYGHTSAAGAPPVFAGQTISKINADMILSSDLAPVEAAIARLVKVPLNQNQFDALGSFHFNTGWLEHQHCSLLAALNAGNYNLAGADFCLYDRAGGKVLAGLDRRRRAERAMFLKPVAPISNEEIAAAGQTPFIPRTPAA